MSPHTSDHETPIILFDGVCNLCTASVQFVIPRDPRAHFKFASLQSPLGQRLLAAHGLDPQMLDSVVLIEGAACWTQSDAALRIVRELTGWWPLLRMFAGIPRPIRNGVYRWIARHRYRWFGQRDTCMLPSPDVRNRFLAS
jgi:predicted DCC family thiol-disulfide oxidoreductase YuxK